MNEKWDNIINTLSYIKPEQIDKTGIKLQLDLDRSFDIYALDKLYMMHILNKDEYIKYIKRLIEIKQEDIRFLETVIDDAKASTDYDPMSHYGLCSAFPLLCSTR